MTPYPITPPKPSLGILPSVLIPTSTLDSFVDSTTNLVNPVVGSIVGDNRSGRDYRQTLNETYQERYGDCEDMATLELAFYNHFNVEAYVVGVNAASAESIDHAATIVRVVR